MNPNHDAWLRLTAAARRAPAGAYEAAPYGFAARVAALGLAARSLRAPGATLEKFAWRGLFAAGAFSAAAVAFGFTVLANEEEVDLTTHDIVAEILAES